MVYFTRSLGSALAIRALHSLSVLCLAFVVMNMAMSIWRNDLSSFNGRSPRFGIMLSLIKSAVFGFFSIAGTNCFRIFAPSSSLQLCRHWRNTHASTPSCRGCVVKKSWCTKDTRELKSLVASVKVSSNILSCRSCTTKLQAGNSCGCCEHIPGMKGATNLC